LFGEVPFRMVIAAEEGIVMNHKIKRMEPRSEYRFKAAYEPHEDESSDASARVVEFRVLGFRSDPSPVLRLDPP
jgi:hypothetical protein